MLHEKRPKILRGTKLSLIAAVLLFFAACNSDEKKTPKEETTVAAGNFKLNCVLIQKAQVQQWVDKGWTDPAKPDSLIKKILLQFYSADAANANTNMQLATFPAKNYTTVYASGRADAAIDPTCTGSSPTGKAIFGNSYLNLKELKITDARGKLIEFSYIRLRPVQDKMYGDYITFAWEVVRIGADNTQTILNGGTTSDPCPTFCPIEAD